MNLYDFEAVTIDGKTQKLADYRGKTVLVVNVASECGYTPQYEALEALHARLESCGFAVLGFPSNDFMGQEPGSEEEIRDFCTLTYGVKFPMFEKVVVTGDGATPLYRELAAATGEEPGWNFHKYLLDRHGRVVASFPSKVVASSQGCRRGLNQSQEQPAFLRFLSANLSAQEEILFAQRFVRFDPVRSDGS